MINERLIHTELTNGGGSEIEGKILHLDADDVDSYGGSGNTWYDLHNFPDGYNGTISGAIKSEALRSRIRSSTSGDLSQTSDPS